MIKCTKENEKQLERLEILIQTFSYADGNKNLNNLKEINSILKNETLDLNRSMNDSKIPVLCLASRWIEKDIISLFLINGVDVNRGYNTFKCSDEDLRPTGFINETLNSIDILIDDKKNCLDILSAEDLSPIVLEEIENEILKIDSCIEILISKGACGIKYS